MIHRKNRYHVSNRKYLILNFLVFVLLLGIGYSVLMASLGINGTVVTRSMDECRITSVSFSESSGRSHENVPVSFTKNTITVDIYIGGEGDIYYEGVVTNDSLEFDYVVSYMEIHKNTNIMVTPGLEEGTIIPAHSSLPFNFSFGSVFEQSDVIEIVYTFVKAPRMTYNLDGGVLGEDNNDHYFPFYDDYYLYNPTKEGYTFAGWTTTDESERVQNYLIDERVISNMEFTAHWKKNVEGNLWWDGDSQYVTLPITKSRNTLDDFLIDSENGKIVIYVYATSGKRIWLATWDSSVTEGHTFVQATSGNYTKDGRTFNYFLNTNQDSSVVSTSHIYITTRNVNNFSTFTIDDFFTEINNYLLNDYTVTYDANGGVTTSEPVIKNPGFMVDLPTDTTTRDGYIFLGWSLEEDGDLLTSYKMYSNNRYADNVTLYAQWVKDEN